MSKQYFTDEFKIEAVKQITELGYSTSEVTSRLGVSEPTRVFRRQFILSHATLADSSNRR